MTDTTDTQIDEETAQRALGDLEMAAMNGQPVTPTQLAEARERVTLAGLWRKGDESRAEARQRRDQDDARAAAKTQVAELLSDDKADLTAAKQAVADAITNLLTVVAGHNERIDEAVRLFARAEVPNPATWGQLDPMDVPGLDRDNYAWIGQGNEIRFVKAAGVEHHLWQPGSIAQRTISDAVAEQKLGRSIEIQRY